MASWIRRLAMSVALGGLVVAFSFNATAADEKKKDKVTDVSTIMKKVNGKKGLTAKVSDAAKGGMWEDAQKAGKELKEMSAALGKNDPHKGDKASWEKLTKKYAEDGAAISEAADKKDADAVAKAAKTFGGACKTCHDAHK
jgi:cytochrome c556